MRAQQITTFDNETDRSGCMTQVALEYGSGRSRERPGRPQVGAALQELTWLRAPLKEA